MSHVRMAYFQRENRELVNRVTTVYARADSGFYCWDAYEKRQCQFILVARKTARLVDELKAVRWTRSPGTDADGQCEFRYQPDGWGAACRFLALRYKKEPERSQLQEPTTAIDSQADSRLHGVTVLEAPPSAPRAESGPGAA